jgi:uncharacterized RDD family membrane protein YckC
MGMYGNFAVWSLHDQQPVWADGAETGLLARVSPSVRLKVLRREAAHYLVRLPDMRQGYVRVDDVAAAPMSPASDMLRREAPRHTGVRGDFVPSPIFFRFVARMIDSVLVWIALVVVSIAFGAGGVSSQEEAAAGGGASVSTDNTVLWVSLFAVYGLAFLYEWIGTAAGGTIGKSMLKVTVIAESTGHAPGLKRSFFRYGGQLVVHLVTTIGLFLALEAEQWLVAVGCVVAYYAPYLWAFVDDGHTVYDRIAGTWVVQYR